MEQDDLPFSQREGLAPTEAPIKVRHEAPPELRSALIQLGRRVGLTYGKIVDAMHAVFLKSPEGNRSDSDLIREAEGLIHSADWPKIYDFAEYIYTRLQNQYTQDAISCQERYENLLNTFFLEHGIGWQMLDGKIRLRGPHPHESTVAQARKALQSPGRSDAARELDEAHRDLSRRPDPDITGAITHAFAALECLAREVTGDPKSTLGELIKKHPTLFPKPVDEAMAKLWGYASDSARHVRQGGTPDLSEAILVVGIAASSVSSLIEKGRLPSTP